MNDYTMHFKSVNLCCHFNFEIIAEICLAICHKILRHYESLIVSNPRLRGAVLGYLHVMFAYFRSKGMPLHNPYGISITSMILIYDDRGDGNQQPLGSDGFRSLDELLATHPKLIFNLLINIVKESMFSIKIKLGDPMINNEDRAFVNILSKLCDDMCLTHELIPLVSPYDVTSPDVVVKIRVEHPTFES